MYYQKYIVLGEFNNLYILTLYNTISNDDIKANIRTVYIFYKYIKKGKEEKREEKVIIIFSN